MCGISGRYNLDGRPVDADEMRAMRDIQRHRGPDDAGLFIDGAIGLGHRRLSIIDLAGGHQPLANEDGTVTVVFNGEIYNFAEIRAELLARGHRFATRSDTEVIVHLYEEMGTDCMQRFRGMFAFALWDSRRRLLLLARDRLGIKPLYYAHAGQSLVFASEIKGLLQSDAVKATLDVQGLRRYLAYRHPYGHGTLFQGVRQLPPGHCLVACDGKVAVRRWWNVPEQDGAAVDATPEGFLALLDEAVALRMISDVPLGAFLSGGIDSSAITALMARHTDQVRTFSIGFVPGEESELRWARRVAEHCGARHHEFNLGAEDFFALLRQLVWNHDEPLAFPASIPLYLLSLESKAEATVMLAGEGADEILAGYGNNVNSYRLARMMAAVPLPLRQAVASLPLPERLARIARRATEGPAGLITSAFRFASHEQLARASRHALPAGADDDADLLAEIGFHGRRGSFLDQLLYFQFKTYLVALLMKQDKMSMAASIETRVPFLDHHVVERCARLPDRSKIAGRRGKVLLRQACRRLLPHEVIDRPKQGFPVPIASWLRAPGNPFVEVLLDPATLRDGLLDGDFVRSRVQAFRQGQPIARELWALLNLELWRRAFLERAPAPAAALAT